ncbi:uncharacterized protein V1510DRAFT_408775 [Dipodascopsis tothii]|uniref:uncharacterized protein n=1 Tax=Dipodascopsis tothii TaxID=44089 RepID=UPI0034CD9B6D
MIRARIRTAAPRARCLARWASTTPEAAARSAAAEYKARNERLLAGDKPVYPVLRPRQAVSVAAARAQCEAVAEHGFARDQGAHVVVRGRIARIRTAGGKLAFMDIVQNEATVQVVYRQDWTELAPAEYRRARDALRRGDVVSVAGVAGRSQTGEPSVCATEPVELLAPCLHPLPATLSDEERAHHRTLELLVARDAREVLRARSYVVAHIRAFLGAREFMEVQTPLLSTSAGGAAARPFVTRATALGSAGTDLELRIAPELWLKRLVVAGFDRVYELGPVFRNEGVDATHNPEFTVCEFYQAYATLGELVATTEELLRSLAGAARRDLPVVAAWLAETGLDFDAPFRQIEFVPALEAALGRPLDVLAGPEADAAAFLAALFAERGLAPPAARTVAQYLDRLFEVYIEPALADGQPTFVLGHPEALSPLAKAAGGPGGVRLARRFELYVGGKELANAYEEENSPFDQRRKFEAQARDRAAGDAEAPAVDEAYLAALEYGLPPTGGWGMGVDRLVMLLTGSRRIGQVLAFGGVRAVVGQE